MVHTTGKTYLQIVNLDESCSLYKYKQNLQPLFRQNACGTFQIMLRVHVHCNFTILGALKITRKHLGYDMDNERKDNRTKREIRIKPHTETCSEQKIALLSITLSWSANFASKTLSYDSEIGSQDIITSVKKPLLTIYPSGLPLRQPEKQWPREKP